MQDSCVASRLLAAHVLRMSPSATPAIFEIAGFRTLARQHRVLFGAALAGAVPGALFATEIVHAAVGVWSAYMAPAFFELLLSGIPFCG